MANGEATNGEIMEFLQEHMVTKTDLRESEERFESKLNGLGSELLQEIRASELRTLDKMDEKFMSLKSDLVVLIRKEDNKLGELVQVLKDKNILVDADLRRILGMEPFPRSV